MRLRRFSEAQVEERHRLRSHILMDAGDLGSRNLTVTWVELPAGAEQPAHSHEEAEQIYVIVAGSGLMRVAGDEERVGEGDLVFIPPASEHSLVNDGSETLTYVTAASPPVSMDDLYREELPAEVGDFEDDG